MPEQQSEKAKMLAGELYLASDAELSAERRRAKSLCHEYNRSAADRDQGILAQLFGYTTDAYLEPPFFCDYGYNVGLGRNVYANHNMIVLDCAAVSIGDDVYIGPNVVIATAGHPIDPVQRRSGLEWAKPIRIGSNVWIGATVTIVPGVEIGDNVTIGAGSVVTRSIPPSCVAVGNPCRVVRTL